MASTGSEVRPTSRWRSSTPPPDWEAATGPTSGAVELPFRLYWSEGSNRFDLANRARLRSLYQIVLTEGTADNVKEFINQRLLLDVWSELWLSRAVHENWDQWIHARIDAPV